MVCDVCEQLLTWFVCKSYIMCLCQAPSSRNASSTASHATESRYSASRDARFLLTQLHVKQSHRLLFFFCHCIRFDTMLIVFMCCSCLLLVQMHSLCCCVGKVHVQIYTSNDSKQNINSAVTVERKDSYVIYCMPIYCLVI